MSVPERGRKFRIFHHPALLGLTTLVMIFAFLGVTIFYSLPSNVLSSRDGGVIRVVANSVSQQSWVFFTRSPSQSEYEAWDPNGPKTLMRLPQSSPGNVHGILRTQRAQGPEIAQMVNQISREQWTECVEFSSVDTCVAEVSKKDPPLEVKNFSGVPTICGEAVLIESQAVPWQYQNYYDEVRLPMHGVAINANCGDIEHD